MPTTNKLSNINHSIKTKKIHINKIQIKTYNVTEKNTTKQTKQNKTSIQYMHW